MTNSVHAIQIEHLSVSLNKQLILKDISASFDYGRIYGIIGHNGSGKTMLLRAIAGLVPYQRGSIYVAGNRVYTGVEQIAPMGIVFEDVGFIDNLSGFKNLRYLANIRSQTSLSVIRSTMAVLDLDDSDSRPYRVYSRGFKKRLAIAQALMESPDILLLDEPFNGLDQPSVLAIYKLLRKLAADGCCVLLCSHYPDDIRALSSKVSRMHDGCLDEIVESSSLNVVE